MRGHIHIEGACARGTLIPHYAKTAIVRLAERLAAKGADPTAKWTKTYTVQVCGEKIQLRPVAKCTEGGAA